ncbi:hypothetical protein BT69DRAFT_1352930 [Atractiella rhizophila]|nr:hypothetical protein BT69DRAFT_1352930 [Atractiella rhizophila]
MTTRKRETTRARAVESETSHPPLDDEPPQGIIVQLSREAQELLQLRSLKFVQRSYTKLDE